MAAAANTAAAHATTKVSVFRIVILPMLLMNKGFAAIIPALRAFNMGGGIE
jgi:hypothetical protein